MAIAILPNTLLSQNKINLSKQGQFQYRDTQINWKIVALAITILIVSTGVFVFFQEQIQSSSNPPINPSPTPAPTKTPTQSTVTASPSNTTIGLVTIVAEVKNQGTQYQSVLVVMQIQEPNGDIMSISNSTSTLEIPAGGSKTTTFLSMIPLNTKIGEFNVNIDVYDSNQTTKYVSTGFIYPFTTPIRFYIFVHEPTYLPTFYMVVDGKTYQSESGVFYWYLGTTHTIIVPEILNIPDSPSRWKFSDIDHITENTLQLTVTANSTTTIAINYGPYFG